MSSQSIEETLEKRLEYSYLYDFYGALLKDNNRSIIEDYIENDYSLSEIARMREMSRQGVYDIVKRSLAKLQDYENRLGLIDKFEQTKAYAKEIHQLACEIQNTENHVRLLRIEELTNQMIDQM